jgi:hypothetical protein
MSAPLLAICSIKPATSAITVNGPGVIAFVVVDHSTSKSLIDRIHLYTVNKSWKTVLAAI